MGQELANHSAILVNQDLSTTDIAPLREMVSGVVRFVDYLVIVARTRRDRTLGCKTVPMPGTQAWRVAGQRVE
jgi:hypothetical protein